MTTKIVHCKKEDYDEYIGRPSLWGNPYEIGRDGSRQEVIDKYRKYFLDRIKNDEDFKRRTNALKGKTLGCWCSPKPCHGRVIAEYLDKPKGLF